MIFAPDEDQAVVLNALDRLAAPYRAVSTEAVVQRSVYSPQLQRELIEGGFADIGLDGPELGLLSALISAETSKLPVAVEMAASALVRPAIDADLPGPVALVWGPPTAPARFLPQARTAILADEGGVRLLEVTPGDVEAVESMFAFPMGRLTSDAVARARPTPHASVERVKQWWRTAVAIEIYGALDAAHRLTVEHVRDRNQFGRPLGSFQAIQHRLAMAATTIQAIRWLALRAANTGEAADAGIAATYAQDTCKTVIYDLHQFSGAMGMTLEYSLHLFTYRVNFLQSQLGGAARQAVATADLIWDGSGASPKRLPVQAAVSDAA